MPRSLWLRALLGIPLLALIGGLLWWRGPDWNVVYHAFDLVNWAWVAFALGLNLISVLVALARLEADDRPGARAAAARFISGLLRVLGRDARERGLPGRIGELARVAVLATTSAARPGRERDARGDGLRTPALRPLPRRCCCPLRGS